MASYLMSEADGSPFGGENATALSALTAAMGMRMTAGDANATAPAAAAASRGFLNVAIAANACVVCLLLLPLFTFVRPTCKEGFVGDRAGHPFFLSLFNNVLWTLYAVHALPGTLLSLILNGFGIGFQVFYILFFICFADVRKTKCLCLWLLAVIVTSTVMTTVVLLVAASLTFLAVIASALATLAYVSAMYDLFLMVDSQNVDGLCFLQMTCSFCNVCLWTASAILSKNVNYYVLIPNVVGIVNAIANFIVYLKYRGPQLLATVV